MSYIATGCTSAAIFEKGMHGALNGEPTCNYNGKVLVPCFVCTSPKAISITSDLVGWTRGNKYGAKFCKRRRFSVQVLTTKHDIRKL